MIHFVLNNLSRPAGEVFRTCLHLQGLILHLDCLITLTLAGAAEKRQTALLGVVRAVLLDDFWIEHDRICRSSSALIKKGDDALAHANHIRSHANTAFSVGHQRIKQILCDLQIFFRCDFPARNIGSCISSFIMINLYLFQVTSVITITEVTLMLISFVKFFEHCLNCRCIFRKFFDT